MTDLGLNVKCKTKNFDYLSEKILAHREYGVIIIIITQYSR